MKLVLAVAVLFLTAPFSLAAEPSAAEKALSTLQSEAMDRLFKAMNADDDKAARQAYEQINKAFPGKEVADRAASYYAGFHLRHGRLDAANDLLLGLKRSGRTNSWVAKSVIGLADIAQARGDERAMLGYLEESLKGPAAPTERNLMDTLDTRQEAMIRLAHHYRDKGDFKKALDYFTRWQPESWCGNCQFYLDQARREGIARCQLHLGDHRTVVNDRLLQLRKGNGLSAFDAWLLSRLYADAGQTDDLRRMLDEYDRNRKRDPDGDRNPIRELQRLLRVETLARKKDVGALIAFCMDDDMGREFRAERDVYQEPARCAAAEALAALDATAAIEEALAKSPKKAAWLVYALGRSRSPASLEALTKLAEREGGDKYFLMVDIAYALALRGESGQAVLKRLAKDGRENIFVSARQFLGQSIRPPWPAPDWPRPKALPQSLVEVR